MGLRPQMELVVEMKQDLDRIRLFLDLVLVWTEMVPRVVCRYARDVTGWKRAEAR